MVLSHYQATPLLSHRDSDSTEVDISLDLGRTTKPLQVTPSGLRLPSEDLLGWDQIETIAASENGVFELVGGGEIDKLTFYSETTERAYSLFPTESAPTMLVSGITMHRIVDSDPWEDTRNKMKAFGKPPIGRVLDTCMGLGYTAIQASMTAQSLITIELDPTVVEVCQANPWSAELFSRPNIDRRVGHAWDVVETLESGSFSAIVHDPPMVGMGGDLYATDFYKELYRLLAQRGRLFHYIGNPNSKLGSTTTRGVIKRLKEIGFKRVLPKPQAFGLLAIK